MDKQLAACVHAEKEVRQDESPRDRSGGLVGIRASTSLVAACDAEGAREDLALIIQAADLDWCDHRERHVATERPARDCRLIRPWRPDPPQDRHVPGGRDFLAHCCETTEYLLLLRETLIAAVELEDVARLGRAEHALRPALSPGDRSEAARTPIDPNGQIPCAAHSRAPVLVHNRLARGTENRVRRLPSDLGDRT